MLCSMRRTDSACMKVMIICMCDRPEKQYLPECDHLQYTTQIPGIRCCQLQFSPGFWCLSKLTWNSAMYIRTLTNLFCCHFQHQNRLANVLDQEGNASSHDDCAYSTCSVQQIPQTALYSIGKEEVPLGSFPQIVNLRNRFPR